MKFSMRFSQTNAWAVESGCVALCRATSSLIKVWSGTAGAPFLLNFFTLPSTSFAAAAWIAEPKAPKVGMRAWMPSMKGCAWTGQAALRPRAFRK